MNDEKGKAMKISDERREIVRNLREEAAAWRKTFSTYPEITGEVDCGDMEAILQDVTHFCGIDGKTTADAVFDRLADLIWQEVTCGECDYCIRNERGELWCMRDPNHTGRGIPTNEDEFCSWGVLKKGADDGD